MEKDRPVDVYEVHLFCDKCGGLMKPTNPNVALLTYPAQYGYYCEKCGDSMTSFIKYPYIRYEERK